MKRWDQLLLAFVLFAFHAAPGPAANEPEGSERTEPQGLAALAAIGTSGQWGEAHLALRKRGDRILIPARAESPLMPK